MKCGLFLSSHILVTTHSNSFQCICDLQFSQLSFALFSFSLILYSSSCIFFLNKSFLLAVADSDFFHIPLSSNVGQKKLPFFIHVLVHTWLYVSSEMVLLYYLHTYDNGRHSFVLSILT